MTVLPPTAVLLIEEVACQVAVGADDPPGEMLRPETKVAIENAESDAATVDRRCVRCTEDQARDLLEYFDRAAAALEVRGDYDRSTSCAQAAELIRRTLAGRVTT